MHLSAPEFIRSRGPPNPDHKAYRELVDPQSKNPLPGPSNLHRVFHPPIPTHNVHLAPAADHPLSNFVVTVPSTTLLPNPAPETESTPMEQDPEDRMQHDLPITADDHRQALDPISESVSEPMQLDNTPPDDIRSPTPLIGLNLGVSAHSGHLNFMPAATHPPAHMAISEFAGIPMHTATPSANFGPPVLSVGEQLLSVPGEPILPPRPPSPEGAQDFGVEQPLSSHPGQPTLLSQPRADTNGLDTLDIPMQQDRAPHEHTGPPVPAVGLIFGVPVQLGHPSVLPFANPPARTDVPEFGDVPVRFGSLPRNSLPPVGPETPLLIPVHSGQTSLPFHPPQDTNQPDVSGAPMNLNQSSLSPANTQAHLPPAGQQPLGAPVHSEQFTLPPASSFHVPTHTPAPPPTVQQPSQVPNPAGPPPSAPTHTLISLDTSTTAATSSLGASDDNVVCDSSVWTFAILTLFASGCHSLGGNCTVHYHDGRCPVHAQHYPGALE
jgi:hypothetical protein